MMRSKKNGENDMNKSWKTEGIWSIILFSFWIIFILIGTGPMISVYEGLGISQTMLLGVSSIICLVYVLIQTFWAVSPLAGEKTLDTLLSFVPAVLFLGVTFIIGFTSVEMAPDSIFWGVNWLIFLFTLGVDLWVGNATANMILTLKDVETRQDT